MASQFSFSFAYHTYLLVSHHANEFEKPTTFIIVVELCWNTHIRADKIEKRSFKKRKKFELKEREYIYIYIYIYIKWTKAQN